MKKNIDDYDKQFPNYVKLDYYLSLFSSKIKDLTKNLKKMNSSYIKTIYFFLYSKKLI